MVKAERPDTVCVEEVMLLSFTARDEKSEAVETCTE
jgi:hypothetical protein